MITTIYDQGFKECLMTCIVNEVCLNNAAEILKFSQ